MVLERFSAGSSFLEFLTWHILVRGAYGSNENIVSLSAISNPPAPLAWRTVDALGSTGAEVRGTGGDPHGIGARVGRPSDYTNVIRLVRD
jgi:hypothetical protein